MKRVILYISVILLLGCQKDIFDLDSPDPRRFVRQLKEGTYNKYEIGENKEKLWAIMPIFGKEHIPELIDLAKDTSLVYPFRHFPVNPISSIPAYRNENGKAGILLGEYLLWCVEGIIKGSAYGSLVPVLKDTTYTEKRLCGKEILEVRKLYGDWWVLYAAGSASKLPLEDTKYHWW